MVDGAHARGLEAQDHVEHEEPEGEDRAPAGRVRSPAQPAPAPRPVPRPAPAAPATPAAAAAAPVPAAAPKSRRRWTRPVLFGLLPVALMVGGYLYVTGGQIVSTDNAYVAAQTLGVSTDVAGIVAAVEVHNNEAVSAGQVLFRLRDAAFHTALAAAEAQLGTVRNQILTLQATYKQSLSQIDQAKADLPFYQTAFKRQQDLMSSSVASKASYDQASHDLVAAQAKVAVSKTQAQAMLAQLGGDPDQPVEENPFFLQAKAAVDNAQRDLDDTVVRAPFTGIVTNVDALQVGAYLAAAQPGFSLISTSRLWVEASPKETELTHVTPGQTATVTVDTYPGVAWTGRVESISPASGSSFSLLPAQNTTGNWVKVVQRIPMRVALDLDPGKPPLRVGMSAVVDVDTGHARGLPTALQSWFGRSANPHG